jgi:hypothetical protein
VSIRFLGCEGEWLIQADGSTACQGQLQTFTVQEMRDQLAPSIPLQDKAMLTGAIVGLLALVWAGRQLMTIPK